MCKIFKFDVDCIAILIDIYFIIYNSSYVALTIQGVETHNMQQEKQHMGVDMQRYNAIYRLMNMKSPIILHTFISELYMQWHLSY